MKIMVNELLGKCDCNYKSDNFKNVPKSNTFFFCTIEEAKYLRNQMLGIVAYDDKCFNVSEWLPSIGSSALNWKDSYYVHSLQLSEREVGKFCRSNSGDKKWAGQLIKDMTDVSLIQSQVSPDELMFIAPKMDIAAEWRIWMKDGDCMAYTSYHNQFCDYCGEGGNEKDAVDFAKWMSINEFEPDERYVVDIAYTVDGYKVVEYNSYSTSGFYGVDADKLIRATFDSFDKEA